YFLRLRLISSVLIATFLAILLTPFGERHYRLLGITLFSIPASFIAWMIFKSPEGAASPYYAGLNLVLLVLAFVLHWTFRESLTASALVFALYLAACFCHQTFPPQRLPLSIPETAAQHAGELVNNLYFLGLTAVIVVTGSY